MIFETNKDKGRTSLGIAIAYFTSNGYTVSIPLNDTQDYDLIVEKAGILNTVQVKSTGCKTKYGKYQVALKSCGGTKGTTYKTLICTNVNLLCVITERMDIYVIPVNEIENKTTLNLCDKYLRYKKI